MGKDINTAEQLEAIIDLIVVNPFTKSVTVDVDGNKKYTYTPNYLPQVNIPCLDFVLGRVNMLFSFLSSALVQFETWQPDKLYRKYHLARYGLDDYMAIADTVNIPTTADWVLVRQNIQGPAGESGFNIPITI
jgi:hypothetical protein